MHKKAKHSKFKNAGILFELLTRQITADILAGRDESFTKNLMFKYFHESKELGKEAQLYYFILQQSSKDANSAERILNVVLQTRSKLDERELNKQKYSIIKEIKEKYNIDEFLKNKIPNYKLYASVYKLFENQSDQEVKFNVEELLESREYVVENLIKEKKSGEESLDVYGSQSAEDLGWLAGFLVPEMANPYDKTAVAIYAFCPPEDGLDSETPFKILHGGYMDNESAKKVHKKILNLMGKNQFIPLLTRVVGGTSEQPNYGLVAYAKTKAIKFP